MNKIKFLIVAFALTTCLSSCIKDIMTPPSSSSALRGEWEEQSSIWMGWSTYENIVGKPTQSVHAEMIKALAPHILIDMAVQDSSNKAQAISDLIAQGVSAQMITEKVRFHIIPHNDIWWRDMGGVFLKNEDNTKEVVDFKFNGWGYSQYVSAVFSAGLMFDEPVDRAIAREMGIAARPSTLILEGGAIESNGAGTIIVTESVIKQRNPGMSITTAEAELKRVLKVSKVIWLPRGLGNDVHAIEGSPYIINGEKVYTPITTNGHTDEFVRFAGPNTILLAEVPLAEATDTIAKYSRAALLQAEAILKSATDQNGKPFTIIRMPDPGTILETVQAGDGTFDFLASSTELNIDPSQPIKIVSAASYLNYVVSNGVVLLAKYARADRPADLQAKDNQALRALQTAFPNRQIIQIDPTNINVGGGGMHCITQHVPK